MELTKDQLNEHIITTFKGLVSGELLDVIKAQIAPYQQAQTDLVSQMLSAHTTPKPEREKGLACARIARAAALGKTSQTPVHEILKSWGDEDLSKAVLADQQKALAAGTGTAGGFLVPEQFSTDIIPLRRAATVVRSSGPREIAMPTGTVKIPKFKTSATGAYIGENANAPVSEPSFGNITLTWKKLAVIVPVSNDLLRYSSPSADAIVRDDMVQSLAVTEDAVFLRSNGTNGEPMGLRYFCPLANVLDAQAASLANVAYDLGKLILQMKNNNVPMIRPVLLMSPRTEFYLLTVQNTSGFWAFRDEMVTRKTVYGVPYKVTTTVPNTITVGANSDCSELYLVDMDSIVIGDSMRLSIDVSQEAAYMVGGVAVSAFSLDQTLVRAIAEHDLGVRDTNAIVVMNGVRWGA